jgi:hypothetical protein
MPGECRQRRGLAEAWFLLTAPWITSGTRASSELPFLLAGYGNVQHLFLRKHPPPAPFLVPLGDFMLRAPGTSTWPKPGA